MHLMILPMNGDCAPRASKADLPSKKKDNPRDRSPIDKSHVPESEMWGLTKTIIRQLCKSQIFHFFLRKQEKPKSKPSLHHYKGVTTTVWICTTTPSGQCANSSYTFGLPVVRLRSQPGLSPRGRRNHWTKKWIYLCLQTEQMYCKFGAPNLNWICTGGQSGCKLARLLD